MTNVTLDCIRAFDGLRGSFGRGHLPKVCGFLAELPCCVLVMGAALSLGRFFSPCNLSYSLKAAPAKEISRALDFNHTPHALESIRDWLQEDVSEWAPQGELALRKQIITMIDGDDEAQQIQALRVYGNVCEMQMMLGSHLFKDQAADMMTEPGIRSVLHHLRYGTDEQNTYGLADAVHEHLKSTDELSIFGSKMQAAKRSMQSQFATEL